MPESTASAASAASPPDSLSNSHESRAGRAPTAPAASETPWHRPPECQPWLPATSAGSPKKSVAHSPRASSPIRARSGNSRKSRYECPSGRFHPSTPAAVVRAPVEECTPHPPQTRHCPLTDIPAYVVFYLLFLLTSKPTILPHRPVAAFSPAGTGKKRSFPVSRRLFLAVVRSSEFPAASFSLFPSFPVGAPLHSPHARRQHLPSRPLLHGHRHAALPALLRRWPRLHSQTQMDPGRPGPNPLVLARTRRR